jgi:hypothetical protein
MDRRYVVSRDLGHKMNDGSFASGSGLWYVHQHGHPLIPVFGTFRESKREAQAIAREMNALAMI